MPEQAIAIPTGQVAADQIATLGKNTDLSIMGMFMHMDALTKLVTLTLVVLFALVIAVIINKYILLKNLNRKSDKFEDAFWSGESLDKLYERIQMKPTDPMGTVFCIGMKEWRRGQKTRARQMGSNLRATLTERIDRVMNVSISREMALAERYMIILANVGSSAPFIGLFGTVIGIMNAFTAIAATNNTSLATVAPGIAEALLTTAAGLLAAIPAVIGYNKFNSDLGRYGERLDAFATEFSSILGRYLEDSAGEAQPQQQYASQQQVA
ncbi:MAG TPA: protein TolQ [Alphaproteobacteria bacterium]